MIGQNKLPDIWISQMSTILFQILAGHSLELPTFVVVVIFQGMAPKKFFLKKLPSTIANVSFLKNIF